MHSYNKVLLFVSVAWLQVFILLPCEVHAKPSEHDMAFVQALKKNDCDKVKSLLQQKLIDAGAKLSGMSLLSMAASKGNLCMMQALLDAGADVNDADSSGMPIISAYSAKQYDAVELLVKQGATIPEMLTNMAKIAMARGNPEPARALGLDTDRPPQPKKKKSGQEATELKGPGYYPGPGYFTGPCAARVDDNKVNTKPGDSGSSVLVYSVFKDVARGPVHVKQVMAPQCQPVYLDSPHGYEMTTRVFLEKWDWLCSGTRDVRPDCPYVTKHVIESDYYELKSAVLPRGNRGQCQKGKALAKLEKAFKPTPGLKHTPDEVTAKNALAASLKKFNRHGSKEFVHTYNNGLTNFILYVSRDGCLLPDRDLINEAIRNNCVKPHSLEGAQRLILGSIQQANGKTRVLMRVVEVETGLVGKTGKGDANGTGQQAVETAFDRAFDNMGFKPDCARPMKNDLSHEAPTRR